MSSATVSLDFMASIVKMLPPPVVNTTTAAVMAYANMAVLL